ncbi:MAG: hypothetical protein AB7H48_11060 [Parachlamydiales bacterium]
MSLNIGRQNNPAALLSGQVNGYENLKNFFVSSEAPQKVINERESAMSKVVGPMYSDLDGIWEVAQIATYPFRWLLNLVLKEVAKLFSCLGAQELAMHAKTASRYMKIGFDVYSESPTQFFLIKKTANIANDCGIISEASPVPASQIVDPKIRAKTFLFSTDPNEGEVRFDHANGICRGMSDWFLYLYFKTKHEFSDPRSHMIALGRQFSKGGGVEPVLLQSLNIKNGSLLNLRIGVHDQQLIAGRYPGVELSRYPLNQWENEQDRIIQELRNLPPGGYKVGVPHHSTAYVKVDDHLSFYFDPNVGIIEISGEEVPRYLHALLSTTANGTIEAARELYGSNYNRLSELLSSMGPNPQEYESIIFYPVETRELS